MTTTRCDAIEAGRIAFDLACRSCRYSLRSQPIDAVCPECATPIRASLRDDLLALSDPAWVARLSSATLLVLGSWLLAIPLGLAMHLVERAQAASRLGPRAAIVLGLGLQLLATVLFFFIVWLLTSPERLRERNPVRRVARTGILLGMVIGFTASCIGLLMAWPTGLPPTSIGPFGSSTIPLSIGLLGNGFSLVGWTALFLYARSIAARIPDDRLTFWTTIAMWGLIGGQAVGAITMGSRIVLNELSMRGHTVNRLLNKSVAFADIALMPLMPVVLLLIVIVMVQFARRLRAASRVARALHEASRTTATEPAA